MSFQEAAIAIGLLTPLILGVLAFVEKVIHRKKEPEERPNVPQGMTVAIENPYADELIKELRKDNEENDLRIAELNEQIKSMKERGKDERY